MEPINPNDVTPHANFSSPPAAIDPRDVRPATAPRPAATAAIDPADVKPPSWQDAARHEIDAMSQGGTIPLPKKAQYEIVERHQTEGQGPLVTPDYLARTNENLSGGQRALELGVAAAKGLGKAGTAPLALVAPQVIRDVNRRLDEQVVQADSTGNRLAGAAGAAIPAVASGAAGGGVGTLATLGGVQSAGQAVAEGQGVPGVVGHGVAGALEGAVTGKVLGAAQGLARGIANPIARGAAAAGVDVAGNAAVGAASQAGRNVVNDRPVGEDVGLAAAAGAISGAMFAPGSIHHANQAHAFGRIQQATGAPDAQLAPAPKGRDAAAARYIGDAVGKKIVWFASDSPVNAFPDGGAIYVNANRPTEILPGVVAHEAIAHVASDPAVRAELDSLRQQYPQAHALAEQEYLRDLEAAGFGEKAARLAADPARLAEEASGVFIEHALQKPAVVEDIAARYPGLFARMARGVTETIDRVAGGNRQKARVVREQLGVVGDVFANADTAERGINARPIAREESALDQLEPSMTEAARVEQATRDRSGENAAGAGRMRTSDRDFARDQRLTREEDVEVDRRVWEQRQRQAQEAAVSDDAARVRRMTDREIMEEAQRRGMKVEASLRAPREEIDLATLGREPAAPSEEQPPQELNQPREDARGDADRQEQQAGDGAGFVPSEGHAPSVAETAKPPDTAPAVETPPAPALNRDVLPATDKRTTVKRTPAPRPPKGFSRADIEAKLLAHHKEMNGGDELERGAELQQDSGHDLLGPAKFTFYQKLPGEVRSFLEGRPESRRLFRVTQDTRAAAGADAMHAMGQDRYFDLAERTARGEARDVDEAKQTAAGSPDPSMQFLAKVHDALTGPASERRPFESKTPAQLPPGTRFEFQGEPFRVVEDENGVRILKDHGSYPEVPLDFLDKVPVDKGTLEKPAPEAKPTAKPAPNFYDPEATGDRKPEQRGVFGQTVVDAQGGAQESMFHQPVEVARPNESAKDARIRHKFKEGERATADLYKDPHELPDDEVPFSVAPAGGKTAPTKPTKADDPADPKQPVHQRVRRAVAEAFDAGRRHVTIDPVPNLAKAGASDAAVEHASAKIAAPFIVRDMLARALPEGYNDPKRQAELADILLKNRYLGAHDRFTARGATDHAAAIAKAHDLDAYDRDVKRYWNDPQTRHVIEAYVEHVGDQLNALYRDAKGAGDVDDFRAPRQGRYFDAYVPIRDDIEGVDAAAGEGLKDFLPQNNALAANVKRDRFDKRANYTGSFDTDLEGLLTAVVGPRYNEVTKLRFYKDLIAKGLAVEPTIDGETPKELGGKRLVPFDVRMPRFDPETGKTTNPERRLFLRADLVREVRDVLDTDQRAPENPVAQILTKVQVSGIADAVAHGKNIFARLLMSQGAGSRGFDVAKANPAVGIPYTIAKLYQTFREVSQDTPAVRAELAEMAKAGVLRRPHEPSEFLAKVADKTGWEWMRSLSTGEMLHHLDTSARLIINRQYSELVKQGRAPDTAEARRDFVLRLGNYNRRLMGPWMRSFRDGGFSPFIVAARNYNRSARELLTGNPGFKGESREQRVNARLTQLGMLASIGLTPLLLNMVTTGSPGGRDGTPTGGWDLGGDDADGTHKVWDVLQLAGLRRGLRATGADALIEGVRQGKDANQIAGNAIEGATNAALHPWIGPAPSFAFKALTGRQLDTRGRMEAQTIPGGGAMQYLENLRAATESQNPLLYALTRPAFQSAGLDHKTDDEEQGFLGGLGDTITKIPAQAAGLKDARPGKDAAEELAERLAKQRFGNASMTPEDAGKFKLRTSLLAKLKSDPDAGKAAIEQAVEEGKLSEREAANLHKKAGTSPLAWNVRSLGAAEAAKVYEAATDEERDGLRELVVDKVARASDLSEGQQDELLERLGIDAPPDLALRRELHELGTKAKAYRDAREKATKGDRAARSTLMQKRLSERDQARLQKLQSLSRAIMKAKKEGGAGAASKVRRLVAAA